MTNNAASLPAFRVIAIDGGAASGKSSTSSRLAERLNLMHVDTGSHYRAVTYVCLRRGVSSSDQAALEACLASMEFDTVVTGHSARMSVNGEPPFSDAQLRSPEVNAKVSPFSAIPAIRETVKAYQQSQVATARNSGFAGLVMDGRDIGTVILPDADLKVFLMADAKTRERRRQLEGSIDTIGDRDRRDASRATAPMRIAPDAVVIDNSTLSLEEVVNKISALILALQDQ